jgi:3-hydroxyisobutyrate dehydrogenase
VRLGFVGLGSMGSAMAANLLEAGHQVVVWNRTPGRAASLVGAGATEASSQAEAAAAAEVTFICVSDTPDVEAVVLGPDGIADGAASGSLVVDCSTISPAASRAIAGVLAERGVGFVDAPVTGGPEGARDATLAILVGGSEADVARARPLLETLGRTVTHLGPIGAGQAAKAVNQAILAGVYLGVAEGIVLATKAGLDPAQVVTALSGGAAQGWVLANRSGRMIAGEYPPGFRVALHRKDLGIALDLAREVGAALPVAALCEQLETGLIARGHADDDVSAVARPIREMAGLD